MFARTTTTNIAVLGAILAAFVTTSALRAQPSCSDATMKGTYVLSQSGTESGTPFAIVGEATYDGHGNGSVTATKMFGGTLVAIVGAPATFTVNSNCSGQKTVGPFHFNFVITPDGKTITFIQTDPGVVSAGQAKQLVRTSD
jgi:hypothetical protein